MKKTSRNPSNIATVFSKEIYSHTDIDKCGMVDKKEKQKINFKN